MEYALKVLFIGLGSIGTRHLNNLKQLCPGCRVNALRSDLSRSLREGVAGLLDHQYTSPNQLAWDYDLVFLCNPTSLHQNPLVQIKKAGIQVRTWFWENSIFSADQPDTRLEELLPHSQKVYVAASIRWCGTILALKEKLKDYRHCSARLICSSYLPDWPPGMDYRQVYSARREMGGHRPNPRVGLSGRALRRASGGSQLSGHLFPAGNRFRRPIRLHCPAPPICWWRFIWTISVEPTAGTLNSSAKKVHSPPTSAKASSPCLTAP